MAGKYTIYYFSACKSFHGRAIGPVLTLMHAGKKEGEDFFIKDVTEAPPGPRVGYPQVTFPNGITIGQTAAILLTLGEEFGLAGKTAEEKMLCR